MTGPEHYRTAQTHLARATRARTAPDYRDHVALAQVHATLAAAAASALTATVTAHRSCAAWTTAWSEIADPTTEGRTR